MKRKDLLKLLGAFILAAIMALAFVPGCAAPEPVPGPAGPAGPSGPSGAPAPSPAPAPAPTIKDMLDGLSVSTYGMGGNSFAETAGYTEAIFKTFGARIRAVPGESDAERIWPLRTGEVAFTNLSAAVMYTCQQGIGELFSKWGPSKVRAVWKLDTVHEVWASPADTTIKTLADMKGKRYAMRKGYAMQELDRDVWLTYANLTPDDIEEVYFSSNQDMRFSIARHQADMVALSTGSDFQEIYATAGFKVIPMPDITEADHEAWERVHKISSYFMPHTWDGTHGCVGATPENPYYGWGYPEGFYCFDDAPDDLVYAFCEALDETYGLAVDICPGNWESSLKDQTKDFWWGGFPLHSGTIKYLKDKGVWPSEWDELQQKELAVEAERMAD